MNKLTKPNYMKKHILLMLLASACISIHAQKETDHWFFGVSAGVNFTSGTPVSESATIYNIPEGCASISTPSGVLLFYTDGSQVWNANHTLMPNGTNLDGDISSTQSSIIVPKPASANEYYIFTTDADGDTAGFKYSIVDMTLQSGLGDVTVKNFPIQDSVTEKLVAIRSTVGGSYWILIHKWNTNQFYAYELTASGLQSPVISSTGTVHNDSTFQNTYGQMKFNMCGTRLAVAIGYMNTVELFDFNLNSGVVSNPLTLPMNDHVYGVEFSPDAHFLYVTGYDATGTLSQYDISLATQPLIMASRTPLSGLVNLYGLQIASNGKIYVVQGFNQYLGVINSPNTAGIGCNYVSTAVDLDTASNGYTSGLGLPNFMQTYLKNALSIVCPGAGIEDNMIDGIGIYPNPSSEDFFISLSNIKVTPEISIIDYTGKIIENKTVNDDEFRFGKNYIPGIYFVMIKVGSNQKVLKVIKL